MTHANAMLVAILSTGFGLIQADPAHAQAIDCTRPANAVQKKICGDAELQSLDAMMAQLYGAAAKQANPAQAKELAAQQARWAAGRDKCGSEKEAKACLTQSYKNRNDLLSSYAVKDAAPPTAKTVTFACPDKSDVVVEFFPGPKPRANVTHGTAKWTLPQVKSASGAHYAASGVSVWNKGNEITFEHGGKSQICVAK